jgi:hypothetical protein
MQRNGHHSSFSTHSSSNNPTEQVTEEDNVWVDPNRISFIVKGLENHAGEILAKSPTGSIYNKKSIYDILVEAQGVMITPKRPLRYVREKELRERTQDLFESGWKSEKMFDRNGKRIMENGVFKCSKPKWDDFFVPLKEGQAYHPEFNTGIYRSTDKVPAVIVENYGLNGDMCISYHMDLVRMDPETDLKDAILSLSRFCTKETHVPIITRSGATNVKIPKSTEKRIAIPLAQQDISSDPEESKQLRKETNAYTQKVFNGKSNHDTNSVERLIDQIVMRNDVVLLKTRIALATQNQQKELLLPEGVSADDFFRQYHIEELGIHQDDVPEWMHQHRWVSETLHEKLYRQQIHHNWDLFDESISKGQDKKMVYDYVFYLLNTKKNPEMAISFFALYPQYQHSFLLDLQVAKKMETFSILFKNGEDKSLNERYKDYLSNMRNKNPQHWQEIQNCEEELESRFFANRRERVVTTTTTTTTTITGQTQPQPQSQPESQPQPEIPPPPPPPITVPTPEELEDLMEQEDRDEEPRAELIVLEEEPTPIPQQQQQRRMQRNGNVVEALPPSNNHSE